jgi:HK97 family phage portal protein
MSFMSRLPRPRASAGPGDDSWYYPGGSLYGGLPFAGSGPITSETATRLITVQNCVRVRAATMAQIPCHVFEKLSEDDFREATESPLYKLLNDRPNSWMQSPIFWAMVEAFVCLRGQFIAYKIGLPGRPILELIPITDKVTKIEQNKDYSLTYHVRFNNGETQPVSQDKILHIRGLLTLDGINGVNPIEHAAETIGLGRSSTRFLSNYFGKGLHPGAILEHPLRLAPQDHANMLAAYKIKYAGLNNSQDMMLVDDGMKIQFPTIKLVDAQYLELMKMNEAQICGLYRVPLMLVQSGDKTPTFASAEQFMINYSVIGVAPDCRNYEKTLQSDLMTDQERKSQFIKFNIDALLRGDFKTRMEGFQVAVNTEIMNPNEARKKMEMPPYEGGEIFRTRTSTVKEPKESESKNKSDDMGDEGPDDSSNGGK